MNDHAASISPEAAAIGSWVDGLLTLNEAARVLRISPRTLRRYIHEGTVPHTLYSRIGARPNGAFRFTAGQLREIAEKLWTPPPPPPAQRVPAGMVPYKPRRRA